jgi:hypothetical protein
MEQVSMDDLYEMFGIAATQRSREQTADLLQAEEVVQGPPLAQIMPMAPGSSTAVPGHAPQCVVVGTVPAMLPSLSPMSQMPISCGVTKDPSAAGAFSSDSNAAQKSLVCWGAQVTGSDANCEPGFEGGRNHFKNKFCARCRMSLSVPVDRVRALTPELAAKFSSSYGHTSGFWKPSPPFYEPHYQRFIKVVNNTMPCGGPWILLCKEASPPNLEWAELPKEWIGQDGQVEFRIARGTMVPLPTLFGPAPTNPKSETALAKSGSLLQPLKADGASFIRAERSFNGGDGNFCGVEADRSTHGGSSFEISSQSSDGRLSPAPMSRLTLSTGGAVAEASSWAAGASGEASGESSLFMSEFLNTQRHLSRMLEHRLARSERERMPSDEREHLKAQLDLCRVIISAESARSDVLLCDM